MELKEFFAGNWRALVLVPAMTALIAGVLFVTSADERYEASGVVSIAEYLGGDTPAEVRARIDDFDSALASRQVLTLVAEASPSSEIFRITTEAVGEGGDVRVVFESATQASAEGALDAGVREALILVSESVGRQTGRRLVAADAVAADAVRDLQDIEDAAGAADLQAELARRSGDLLALRNQIAAAADNSAVQGELEETLEQKEQEIADIESQLLPWTNTRARFDLAVTAGADASLALRQVETNEADLQTQQVIQSLRSNEVSNVPDLLRVVVAAAVVTAGAVVVIALLLGSGRRRRPSRPRRDTSSDTPSGGIDLLGALDDPATPWADGEAWDHVRVDGTTEQARAAEMAAAGDGAEMYDVDAETDPDREDGVDHETETDEDHDVSETDVRSASRRG